MTDLSTLTVAACRDYLNRSFRIDVGDGDSVSAELIEVQPRAVAAGAREGFTLLFRGPRAPVLPQRIYELGADGLGPIALFLVPVGMDTDGCLYEAVFN